MDIRIKSFPNGLCVYLNENDSFDEIAGKIESKFVENRNFFGNKKLCVSFSGKYLTDIEEQKLADIIESVTDIEIVCIVEKEESEFSSMCKDIIYGKEEPTETKENEEQIIGTLLNTDCKTDIIEMSLIDTRFLTLKNDTILIGNIDENVKVQSSGNVYVFGSVNGKVVLDNAENVLIAFILNPVYVKIAGFEMKKSKSLLSKKETAVAKKVFYSDGKVISADLSSKDFDYLFNR